MDKEALLARFNVTQVDDSVGYLLSRARTMIASSVDDSLRELDMTHAQASVLFMLWSGKCQTAADLSRDMFTDAGAMKRMLDKMAAKNLLRRVPDAEDKRLFRLQLTPEGNAMAELLPPIFCEVLALSFTGFSEEEVGFLKSLLRKLLANRHLLESKNK